MDLNLVVLSGTLAVAPELHRFDRGNRRLDYLVTVRTIMDGRRRTDTIRVKYWDPPARLVRDLVIRGDRVLVAGTVQRNFWSSFDGKRSQLEVVATQVVHRPSDLTLEAFEPDQNVIQAEDFGARIALGGRSNPRQGRRRRRDLSGSFDPTPGPGSGPSRR